jgi:hypothetical protein
MAISQVGQRPEGDEAAVPGCSTAAPRRRRRAWVRVALAFSLAIGAFVLARHFVLSSAQRTLDRHRAIAEREVRELREARRVRPALLEPAIEGDAEAVWREFAAAVRAVPEPDRQAAFEANEFDPETLEAGDAALARHPTILARLERVLSVPSASPRLPVDGRSLLWDDPADKWLSAALESVMRRREAVPALRLLLVRAAWAEDLTREGTYDGHGSGIVLRVSNPFLLGRVLGWETLPATEARRAREVLDRLEAHRPSLAFELSVERAFVRRALASVELEPPNDPDAHSFWSGRVRRAQALDRWEEVMDRAARIVDRLAAGDRSALEDVVRVASDDPLADSTPLRWLLSNHIETAARSVVVRTALAVEEWTALHGAPPAALSDLVPTLLDEVPRDPFGSGPVRYADGMVWSIGKDGVDEAGEGDDFRAPIPDPPDPPESR